MRKVKCFLLVLFFIFVLVAVATAVEITQVGKVVEPHPNTGEEFLILVSDNFWQVPEVQEAISQYQDDVYRCRQVGSRVFMVSPAEIPFGPESGCGGDIESAKEIREFLKAQYYNEESSVRLIGVILVGDLPWVNVKTPNYTFGVSDIYFGELNFEGWTIVDQQECHYLEIPYCDGGCIHPEIWIARIFPPICFDFFLGACDYPEGGFSFSERVEILLEFFEKDHQYWIEGSDYHNFLAVDSVSEEECWGINGFPVEEGDEVICENKISKERFFDYLATPFRMADFLMLGNGEMVFLGDDYFVPQEVFEAEIRIPGIVCNSSSGSRFDYQNCFSEGYLFGENSEVINVVGLGACTYALEVPFSLRNNYVAKAFQEVICWEQDEPQAFVIIEGDPFVKIAREISFYFSLIIGYEVPVDLKFSSQVWEARPFALVLEEETLILELGFSGFREPVDIYVGVNAQPLDRFFIWTQNGIILWDGNLGSLIPYKREWVRGLEEVIYTGNIADLPDGDYYGYVLVVPAGTDMSSFDWNSSTYYLWHWYWQK